MISKEKLSKLSLGKLIELQRCCQIIVEKYQNELSSYSRLNNDATYTNITPTERIKIEKVNKIISLIEAIHNVMEEHVLSYIRQEN